MTDHKKLIEEVRDLIDDSPDWPRLDAALTSLEAMLDELQETVRYDEAYMSESWQRVQAETGTDIVQYREALEQIAGSSGIAGASIWVRHVARAALEGGKR